MVVVNRLLTKPELALALGWWVVDGCGGLPGRVRWFRSDRAAIERQAACNLRPATGRLSKRRVAPWPTRVLMSSFFRQFIVWLTAGAFLCASVGDGVLHLLLDLSAPPASSGSSATRDGPAHACCALHAQAASERQRLSASSEPNLSEENEASEHNSGACPICQFTAMAKSAQVQPVPLIALLPTAEASVARPVVFLTRSRPAHLPRGPPLSHSQSVC